MEFTFDQVEIDHRTIKFEIRLGKVVLTFDEVIKLFINSEEFKNQLTKTLVQVPFAGFFWEVRPIKKSETNSRFQFVVVNGRRLCDLRADPKRFEGYFEKDVPVASFLNLGKDAKLIVPSNQDANTNYAHLAAFLKTGNSEQINEFWRQVGL
ncbi:MAG: hypothetical protein AAGA85_20870, partial [Bacteroidota bacterium]